MALGRLVLGFPILYLKGMRIMMFQLSGFYCGVYLLSCVPIALEPGFKSLKRLCMPRFEPTADVSGEDCKAVGFRL